MQGPADPTCAPASQSVNGQLGPAAPCKPQRAQTSKAAQQARPATACAVRAPTADAWERQRSGPAIVAWHAGVRERAQEHLDGPVSWWGCSSVHGGGDWLARDFLVLTHPVRSVSPSRWQPKSERWKNILGSYRSISVWSSFLPPIRSPLVTF
jgi:hypothetical protein